MDNDIINPPLKMLISKVAIKATLLLAVVVGLYGLFLLIIGLPGMFIQEVRMFEVSEVVQESPRFTPAPQGFIPFLAAILLIVGLRTRKLLIAWLGLVTLLLFSALFLFGIEGVVLPAAGFLLVLMIIITITQRNTENTLNVPSQRR